MNNRAQHKMVAIVFFDAVDFFESRTYLLFQSKYMHTHMQ